MDSTETIFTDLTSAQISGSKLGGTVFGLKADTEHQPLLWDSECICSEVMMVQDS